MTRVRLKGVHRVRRKLADGTVREHHYAWRGGPRFWSSDDDVKKNSAAYVAALGEVTQPYNKTGLTAPDLIDQYLSSAAFTSKKPRTQADYKRWALRFAREFAEDPATIFEHGASRDEVEDWRDQWRHSPKQYDYAGTVVAVILNWARGRRKIKRHYCDRLPKLYEADRSLIVWSPADLETFERVAPEWVRRILITACETGLRPGDLISLSRFHVKKTPAGRHILIRTNKRGRSANIPVTPVLAKIIDGSPPRNLILTNASGAKLTEHRASEAVRQWRDKAGLSQDLRLQDARGTAATRLLRAGLSLSQIAAHMGWGLRHAANVIERYASVDPDAADQILADLAAAKDKKL